MATRLLRKKAVAARLDVSTRTVDRWIKDGKFPKPNVVLPSTGERGGDIERWTIVAVEAWIAERSGK